jgi:hypothetical protein
MVLDHFVSLGPLGLNKILLHFYKQDDQIIFHLPLYGPKAH